ncbi:MAG: hypothetical protein A2293_01220 [Elusimicrobia bacterium RIFOXYB2_FULL_49_7]|nr:MAG: hypothetical protein A2293_01220 [Elusimicrobia bacterium RIFOXYB2_FULL_49_7]
MEIEIITREMVHTLEMRAETPAWSAATAIAGICTRISEYLQEQKEEPTGVPFVIFTEIDWKRAASDGKLASFIKMFTNKWKLIVGFPVKSQMQGSGEIVQGTIAKGRYIKALHCGPHQKSGDTYKAILAWAIENKLNMKNESVEFLLNDQRTAKPQDFRTEILVPLVD